jgi:hypothetical protein
MFSQVPYHLALNLGLEEHQHEAEPGEYPNLPVPYGDGAADAGALEVDVIAFPPVVDVELAGQVTGKIIGRGLCVLAGQVVVGVQIYVRHKTAFAAMRRNSVDGRSTMHQCPPAAFAR